MWITYSCNKEDIWISKLTKDNKYSIMKPLWCDINYEHNPNHIQTGINSPIMMINMRLLTAMRVQEQ